MENQKHWLVTGVAGFIGSHLAEGLLARGQKVTGLDNLSFGHKKNIEFLSGDFTFIKGDICDVEVCERACKDIDYVLHHAAIGSVVKSFEDPDFVDRVNRVGTFNIMMAAHENNVNRVVYASSSAVYGEKDEATLRNETETLAPLSPYAEGKCANEASAKKLYEEFGLESVGLRYFNIYGSRQDPNGAYAAVIPKWVNAMLQNEKIEIYGDGQSVRDFCYIDDVVQANISAATADLDFSSSSLVYNIASGNGTNLNSLFSLLKEITEYKLEPQYTTPRTGDIKISQANISLAKQALEFAPSVSMKDGLKQVVKWCQGQNV